MSAINVLEQFREHLLTDGKGEKTINSYTGDVRAFLGWLEDKGTVFQGTLTRFYITSYKTHLLEQNYTINTINKKINSLHSFNQFLLTSGYMTDLVVQVSKDKVKIAAGSEGEVEVFNEEEITRLLFYLEDRTRASTRDRVAILLGNFRKA